VSSAQVLDSRGELLSPCDDQKARRLLASGQAELVSTDPYTIRLKREIIRSIPSRTSISHAGEALLLHICCGPCATYTSLHLREQGWDVTGFWYNPNIEPGDEYQKRQQSLVKFAKIISLPMVWELSSDSGAFREAIGDNVLFGERCAICYRVRLRRAALVAAERGIGTISSSLLVSPYQNLELVHSIGMEEAQACGLQFYFENMRSGYPTRTRLSQQYGLYLQTYCGCTFSAQEAEERRARKAACS